MAIMVKCSTCKGTGKVADAKTKNHEKMMSPETKPKSINNSKTAPSAKRKP